MLVVVHNYFMCNGMRGDVILKCRLDKTFFFNLVLIRQPQITMLSTGDAAVILFLSLGESLKLAVD